MINIETGRIVDMIYSRESAEVTEWLKTYPNISVVSRDGSLTYADAIRTAHPKAIQVSDRFHLIKGLTDAARQYITGIIASRIRIEADAPKEIEYYWKNPWYNKPDLSQRCHNATTEKKIAAIQRVLLLAAQGLNIHRISKETGLSWSSIKKYLDENFNPEHQVFSTTLPSKIKPYTATIDKMLAKGQTFRKIEETIRTLGYKGASSTIRMYATKKRRHNQATHEKSVANTEIIERRWLLKLLYNPIEKVKEITEAQLEKVMLEYPELAVVYHIVRTFKEVVFAKRVGDLSAWIEFAQTLGADGINSFVNGLSRDIAAVRNAIKYDYNNGLAEGSINKIKTYKRIMYGRCSFDMLRCKTLMLEQRKTIN